jgi:hypothetical protein
VSVDREQVRRVIDLFSTVYQGLGELAPTYEDDHLVVVAYEFARVAGTVSLLLRSALGDSGFRVIDDVVGELNRPEGEMLILLRSEIAPRLRACLNEARESATGETAELFNQAAVEFASGLA